MDYSPLNITSFGKALGVKGGTIYRWYRDVLSDYAKDKTVVHKHDVKSRGHTIEVPVFEIENFGEKMAIDEKHIGEDICTIISNRETGKIAMLCKSISFADLKAILTPYIQRLEIVKSITRDFSSLFEKVCTELFPYAIQTGDKFHVVRNLMEAHQAVRVRYRQRELDKRRKALHEFKQQEHERLLQCERSGEKFKAAKFYYQEERLQNGETPLEILARSRYLLFKFPNQWNSRQKQRAEILFSKYPEIYLTYNLACQFRNIIKTANIGKHYLEIDKILHLWYEEVEDTDIDEILSFKSMVVSNEDIIRNYFINGDTNALAESINSKIQKFIISNNGARASDFFYWRIAKYFA